MVLETRVTKILGIKHPVIQGGMHYVGYASLAAAVSNAGGLGIITALTQPNPDALREEIRKCKSLTDKPFGVNITLLPALFPPNYDAYIQAIIEEGVKVVETAGNKPDKIIKVLKDNGIIVIHKCVAIRHALKAQKLGADIISVDGFECAGHPGEDDIGNFFLLAKAGRVLSVPFVASGGVGVGSQLAAALAMGAEGVNMGTRFMATVEAPIHPNIKKALVDGDEKSTTHVFRTLNNTERVYKNEQAEKVREIEKQTPGNFAAVANLVKGAFYKRSFQETGNTQDSVWSAGVVMGLIDDIPTCKDLIEKMVAEAETIIQNRLPQFVSHKAKL
eukprot:c14326_g1_i1.p1 GENE.c14326_g1_i1~~c14326_g1_i1.p1  ORF type:complete len:351 (+),score=168.20 c14326_g1_i1:58-1053(+)